MGNAHYEEIEEGKWYPLYRKDSLRCCDCALVHRLELKLAGNRIWIKLERDDKATNGIRKRAGITITRNGCST